MAISDQVRAPQGSGGEKGNAWYALSADDVAAKLGVDPGSGLSAEKTADRLRRGLGGTAPTRYRRRSRSLSGSGSWLSTGHLCRSSWWWPGWFRW